ncbi:MAG: hypothetical protein ACYTFY_03650 [Planctomycetota bacterium]|jgi:hypothetical protein
MLSKAEVSFGHDKTNLITDGYVNGALIAVADREAVADTNSTTANTATNFADAGTRTGGTAVLGRVNVFGELADTRLRVIVADRQARGLLSVSSLANFNYLRSMILLFTFNS